MRKVALMTRTARSKRPKHQPLRTCLGCAIRRPKQELVRVVRTPAGVIQLDATGRQAGRGAYLCPSGECLKAAVKGKRLERVLEVPVPDDVIEELTRAVAEVGQPDRSG